METPFVLWDSSPLAKTKNGYVRLVFVQDYGLCAARNTQKDVLNATAFNIGILESLNAPKLFCDIITNTYVSPPPTVSRQGRYIVSTDYYKRKHRFQDKYITFNLNGQHRNNTISETDETQIRSPYPYKNLILYYNKFERYEIEKPYYIKLPLDIQKIFTSLGERQVKIEEERQQQKLEEEIQKNKESVIKKLTGMDRIEKEFEKFKQGDMYVSPDEWKKYRLAAES